MNVSEAAEAAHRVASAATYGGAATSAASGGVMVVQTYFGFSTAEWQILGVVGGLLIGALGLIVNAVINFYFQYQRLKLDQGRAGSKG